MTNLALEALNGIWATLATSLCLICFIYLRHEIAARSSGWRKGVPIRNRFTPGMRVAVAIFVLSCGIAVRSGAFFIWRLLGGPVETLSPVWSLIGEGISVLGFLCAIREFSKPLYGDGPWVWTLVSAVLFLVMDVAIAYTRF